MGGTVRYGMPPKGYESVTLPTELVESIDEATSMDRAATLRLLLSEYHADDSGPVDARIVDMDAAERRQFAEEVAGVLRE